MQQQCPPSNSNMIVELLKAHKVLKFTGTKCLIQGQVAMSYLQKFSSTYFARGTKYNLLERDTTGNQNSCNDDKFGAIIVIDLPSSQLCWSCKLGPMAYLVSMIAYHGCCFGEHFASLASSNKEQLFSKNCATRNWKNWYLQSFGSLASYLLSTK